MGLVSRWFLSSGELAILGIGFAFLGVLVGAWLQGRSQKKIAEESLASQRALAADERLWHERAATYVGVLGEVRLLEAYMKAVVKAWPASIAALALPRFGTPEDPFIDRLRAFGSAEVTTAASGIASTREEFLHALVDRRDIDPKIDGSEANTAYQRLSTSVEHLIKVIQLELQPRSP